MLLNCDVSLVPVGGKPRYSRAKVGLGYVKDAVYILVITNQRKDKFPFTNDCRLFKSAVEFPNLQKCLFIKTLDQLLLKTFMSYLRILKEGREKPKLPNLDDLENHKVQSTSLETDGQNLNLKELRNDALTKVALDKLALIPKALYKLSNLTQLQLTNCHLTEIPEKLSNLTKLRLLSLANNDINELDIKVLCKFQHLLNLNVSHNSLSFIPLEIGFLRTLTSINFGYNKITLLPYTLVNLVDLKEFIVCNNNIKMVSMAVLGVLERRLRLIKFDISDNGVTLAELSLTFNNSTVTHSFPSLFELSASQILRSVKCIHNIHRLPRPLYERLQFENEVCYYCRKPMFGRNWYSVSNSYSLSGNLASTVMFNGMAKLVLPQAFHICIHCKPKDFRVDFAHNVRYVLKTKSFPSSNLSRLLPPR